MRIATTIDWPMIQQVFMRFFTSKKTKILLIIMLTSYEVYEAFEWHHYNQMIGSDRILSHWGWILPTLAGLWWLWSEINNKHSQQFIAGILFVFLGPALSMGIELRNIHTFSPTERWEMLVCMFVGVISFFVYIRAKWFQS